MIEVIVCQTGGGRHDPALAEKITAAGGIHRTIECFDRCELCEKVLLARIDGTMAQFASGDELAGAIAALAGDP